MSTSAQYASVPLSNSVLINTGNSNRDGSGAIGVLVPTSTTGSRIDDIIICAQVATTAGMIRFFRRRGASLFLLLEVPVTVRTPSATVEAYTRQLTNLAWVLDSTSEIVVSTEKSETFAVSVTRGGAL